ncbi:MAG: hypothetical protein LBC96_06005 [Lachnospiraceae bacterium]|nr:hypothetical protein [Lachnospiraceae bacterium]
MLARISETVGFAGLAKCGGAKSHKGACADWGFAEPEPPELGGEQLPFVM